MANGCHYKRSFEKEALFFLPAFHFQPVDVSKFIKIKNTFLYICVFQKLFVILQRKMNRALVAKKVLQYLAHAEGICLSGGGKYRT